MKQLAFESMVRGLQYHAIGKGLVTDVELGEPVKLMAEPTNPYDDQAIQVMLDRPDGLVMIGYIPKELTYKVHPLLALEGIITLVSHTQLPKFMTVAVYVEGTPPTTEDTVKPEFDGTPEIDV